MGVIVNVPDYGSARALAKAMQAEFAGRISAAGAGFIKSDLFDDDVDMAVDDCLQFTLLAHEPVPEEWLQAIEVAIAYGWDPELVDRTRGWIAKHRELGRESACA